ncbi:hypothetical protein ACQKWADRAFT_284728 [Trichoderma austrokoningii]
MNRSKLPAGSRPPRHRNFQNQNRQNEGPKKFWASPKRMATAKSQVNDMRQITVAAAAGDYRGPPPAGRDLIEATFVSSLRDYDIYDTQFTSDDSEMDDVRRRHQVWIVAEGPESPNVLKIYSESVINLQAAINTLNQCFHDARISRALLTLVRIPQKSSRVTDDTRIRMDPGTRPEVTKISTEPDDMKKTVAALLQELRPHIQAATKCLRSSNSEIRMRVSFGLLSASVKKDQANPLFNWDEFAALVKEYSRWDGLPFCSRFHHSGLANGFIDRLMAYDGADDLRLDPTSVKRTHTLYLITNDGRECKVENWTSDESALSRAKLGLSFPVPYFDWVVTAPDMMLDWSLHAETWGSKSVPETLLNLLKTLKHRKRYEEDGNDFILLPSDVVVTKDPGNWKYDIMRTRLKTSFIAEFQDTPYVLEISMSQEWEGLRTRAPEENIIWQMEFYGKHWDSAMNQVNPVDQRKDFGEGLKHIWVGSDPDLEVRFANFLQVLLKLQHQLYAAQKAEEDAVAGEEHQDVE